MQAWELNVNPMQSQAFKEGRDGRRERLRLHISMQPWRWQAEQVGQPESENSTDQRGEVERTGKSQESGAPVIVLLLSFLSLGSLSIRWAYSASLIHRL